MSKIAKISRAKAEAHQSPENQVAKSVGTVFMPKTGANSSKIVRAQKAKIDALLNGDQQSVAILPDSAKTHVLQQLPAGSKVYNYDQMKAALETHLANLKEVDDIGRKVELKKKWLPEYLPYIEEYLAGEDVHPNAVLVEMTIWAMDTQNFDKALELAEVAIAQGNNSPSRFKASIAEIICDHLFTWCEAEFKAGRSSEPYLSRAAGHLLDGSWSVNDVCGSKLLKLYAQTLEKAGELEKALETYQIVQDMKGGGQGCKGHIQRVSKALNEQDS